MSLSSKTARLMLLYRQCLRNSSSWIPDRGIWFAEARNIRAQFEANKDVTDIAQIDKLLQAGENELHGMLHPDPYIIPYDVGGTLYGRNPPPPINNIELDFGREKGTF